MKGQGRPPKKSIWIVNVTFGFLSIVTLAIYGLIAVKLTDHAREKQEKVSGSETTVSIRSRGQLLITSDAGARLKVKVD